MKHADLCKNSWSQLCPGVTACTLLHPPALWENYCAPHLDEIQRMGAACGSAGGQPPEIPPRHPFLSHDNAGSSPDLLPQRWVPSARLATALCPPAVRGSARTWSFQPLQQASVTHGTASLIFKHRDKGERGLSRRETSVHARARWSYDVAARQEAAVTLREREREEPSQLSVRTEELPTRSVGRLNAEGQQRSVTMQKISAHNRLVYSCFPTFSCHVLLKRHSPSPMRCGR